MRIELDRLRWALRVMLCSATIVLFVLILTDMQPYLTRVWSGIFVALALAYGVVSLPALYRWVCWRREIRSMEWKANSLDPFDS